MLWLILFFLMSNFSGMLGKLDNENRKMGKIQSKISREEKKHITGLILKLEPSGKGSPQKISEYLEKIKKIAVFDERLVCFEIKAKNEKEKLVLTGRVSFPSQKEGLIKVFSALGFNNIEDKIEVLPSKKLGHKIFAIANKPAVPFYKLPKRKSEQVTQAILGESIFLLDIDSARKYYFCANHVGYLGWVEKKNVIPMDLKQFREIKNGPRALFQKNFYWNGVLLIPAGADLPFIETKKTVRLPTGEEILVPETYFVKYDTAVNSLSTTLIENAKQFLSVKYLWGGNTMKGIDCSGFVHTVYRTCGINLPRDAVEQFIVGEIVGFPGYTEDLQPGDLLFFAGFLGRIGHVAMYIGNGEYIHATKPKVTISSLNPTHKNYDAKYAARFVVAKRIIRFK